MFKSLSRIIFPAVLGSFNLTHASQIDIKSYDAQSFSELRPFTQEQIIQGHVSWLGQEYTEEEVQERTPIIIKRIETQFSKLRNGERHLILATDSTQALAGITWVSNPVADIIIVNQSNAKFPDINALCSAQSLSLFPKAKTIQLAIMKKREKIVQLLKITGWKQNDMPSPYLDDENVDIENELFFEIATSEALGAMGQMKQIIEQQTQLAVTQK